jgi:iron(III) transport system substrate-binding protein
VELSLFKKLTLALTLGIFFVGPFAFGASSTPALSKAKQEAEAKGYIFFTAHDEIVDKAKKEGKLKVSTGLDPRNYNPLINAFKQKYPFITDIHLEEIQGIDAFQRFLLEIKSGQPKGWDITYIPLDFANEYIAYLMKYDILGIAKQGVLKIHPGMIHPGERNIVSVTSSIRVVAYNRKLIADDKVPDKWEDFLKPEFKGKKFVAEVPALAVAGLVPAWGLERTLEFARKLAAQQPVWGTGATRLNTAVASGEYSLYWGPNFNSLKRAMSKDPTGILSYKIIEPIPTRIVEHADAILNTAEHPHAALLWLEFLASPEGQEIIDKYEPLRASVFTPGSVVEQMTQGKKLSVVDWNHFAKFQGYLEKIFAAYGFPKADK